MILWGLYISMFWALTLYSAAQNKFQSRSISSSAESCITGVMITAAILGLFYPHVGMTLAPYLLALLPLSLFFELTNAFSDLKNEDIRKELGEDIPDDVLYNVAFAALSATLLPGYVACGIIIVKYNGLML